MSTESTFQIWIYYFQMLKNGWIRCHIRKKIWITKMYGQNKFFIWYLSGTKNKSLVIRKLNKVCWPGWVRQFTDTNKVCIFLSGSTMIIFEIMNEGLVRKTICWRSTHLWMVQYSRKKRQDRTYCKRYRITGYIRY